MALESVTHISDLNPANPTTADGLSEGDDHLRNIKTALTTDFPNINGVVSSSDEDLSACENFEETISATTSEVSIKTGKTLNIVDDGAGLEFGGTALTTPVTTLNLAKGIVFLDTPVELVDISASAGWTTVDMSTAYAAAATAGATAAIIKIDISGVDNGTFTGSSFCFLRKTGSGDGFNIPNRHARHGHTDATNNYSSGINTTTVPLDSNSDFDYYFSGFASTVQLYIHLVGYYV